MGGFADRAFPDARFATGAWVDWSRVPSDSHFRDIPALASVPEIPFPSQVTFLCGENGSGKSSLLEAVASACGFVRTGGFAAGYSAADDASTELGDAMHVMHTGRRSDYGYFFRAETFFGILSGMSARHGTDYSAMSHGEGFLAFLQEEGREGLYLMDEPEAALSPQRQLTLLLHIYYSAMSGSQFVIATHSPILLGLPGASILCFEDDGIHPVEYEETDAYKVTKMFVDEREAILHHLLREDAE